jgi:hypothetical protein
MEHEAGQYFQSVYQECNHVLTIHLGSAMYSSPVMMHLYCAPQVLNLFRHCGPMTSVPSWHAIHGLQKIFSRNIGTIVTHGS